MGIPGWTEQDELRASMLDAGLYIDWPNPYNLEPGLYIIVHMDYTTQADDTREVIIDAYRTVIARLLSRQFRNPRQPIPGRKTLFIRYELINQDDGTANPFPTEIELFDRVQRHLRLMLEGLELGDTFDLPYRFGPVRVFWCDLVARSESPLATVEVFETDSDGQEEVQQQAELPETAQQ